jgi:hypothetical protein
MREFLYKEKKIVIILRWEGLVKMAGHLQGFRLIRRLTLAMISKFVDPLSMIGAILWASDVSFTKRYSAVKNELLPGNVLDLGSDGKSILSYQGIETFSIDLTHKEGIDVIASMSDLPFKDNSFSNVVSVDSLEHIPQKNRIRTLKEMQRVAKRRVIIHCPLEDGVKFRAKKYDILFQQWFIKRFEQPNYFTAEHINNVEPNPAMLQSLGFNIFPKGNVDVWLGIQKQTFLSTSFLPLSVLAGWIFYLFNKSKDKYGPYWGGISIYTRLSNSNFA